MSLVMIQGQNAVITAYGSLVKDRVRADGTGNGITLCLQFLYSRDDLVHFLPSAAACTFSSAQAFAAISGPTPAGSPIGTAILGFFCED